MAKTFTSQARLPPTTTGATWSGDGEPMSTHMMRDMILNVNNLWAIDKPIAALRAPAGYLHHAIDSGETFLGQSLMYVPPGIRRIPWRLQLAAVSGGDVAISYVTLYAMSIPYGGAASPFDVTALPPGYASDSVACMATAAGGMAEAQVVGNPIRIDRSEAGVEPMPDYADDRFDRWVHLAVTVNGTVTDAASAAARIYDFTPWGEKTT